MNLEAARQIAEATLTDHCVITRSTGGEFVPGTGIVNDARALVFDGRCSLSEPAGNRRTIRLPISADDVQVGDRVEHAHIEPSVVSSVFRSPTDSLQRIETRTATWPPPSTVS